MVPKSGNRFSEMTMLNQGPALNLRTPGLY